MTAWDYRIIHEAVALETVVDLEMDIWGLNPRDAAPTNLLHALAQNGGLIAGAYDDQRLIGLSLAFPARRGKQWMLWSHMVGIHRHYQGKGVGFGLKQFQRTWGIEQGYRHMGWTFDPLQRGNANFNLHILGATASIYHENFYGEMTDGINAGLPSDRLEAHWDLLDRRVKALAATGLDAKTQSPPPQAPSLLDSITGTPVLQPLYGLDLTEYRVEIPGDLAALKQNAPSLALEWRMALRQALQTVFAQGYRAVDFCESMGRHYYLLARPSPWFLYVVICNDHSLYTGISPDVERRVAQHNRKRGATYTASRTPVKLAGAWSYPDRPTAMRAELAFKRLSRDHKLKHIELHSAFFGSPFTPAP